MSLSVDLLAWVQPIVARRVSEHTDAGHPVETFAALVLVGGPVAEYTLFVINRAVEQHPDFPRIGELLALPPRAGHVLLVVHQDGEFRAEYVAAG